MNDRDKIEWKRISKWKYELASFITIVFMAFIVGWLFMIPIAVLVFLIYGLFVYMKERKHRISLTIKPTEAMRAIARREAELKIEKEKIYQEFNKKI